MNSDKSSERAQSANRWRAPFLALGLVGGVVGSTMSSGCGDAEEPPPSDWAGEACSVPEAPEECDGIDNDGDGIIDDASCWEGIWRYKDPSSEARCWGKSTGAPAACSGYAMEVEAFSLAIAPGPNRFQLVQCSNQQDHVLVNSASAERTTLEGQGYSCTLALGYAYSPSSSPNTPLPFECPLYRWRYESTPGNASHWFSTDDAIPNSTCEPPVTAVVGAIEPCFASTPSGC